MIGAYCEAQCVSGVVWCGEVTHAMSCNTAARRRPGVYCVDIRCVDIYAV